MGMVTSQGGKRGGGHAQRRPESPKRERGDQTGLRVTGKQRRGNLNAPHAPEFSFFFNPQNSQPKMPIEASKARALSSNCSWPRFFSAAFSSAKFAGVKRSAARGGTLLLREGHLASSSSSPGRCWRQAPRRRPQKGHLSGGKERRCRGGWRGAKSVHVSCKPRGRRVERDPAVGGEGTEIGWRGRTPRAAAAAPRRRRFRREIAADEGRPEALMVRAALPETAGV